MSHLGATRRLSPVGLIAVVLTLSMSLVGIGVGAAGAATAPGRLHAHAKHVKVTAPVTGLTAAGQPVRAVFIPKKIVSSGGGLVAQGILRGRIVKPGTDSRFRKAVTMTVIAVDGRAVPTTTPSARAAAAAFPPAPAAGACNVLNLVLAPLDLNILGLQVHLDQVVLNIVAQSGAGQLLGNLLCFVAGLLDAGGPLSGLLTQLTGLLNQILGALGGLTV
ncbi:MAG: transporter substrate-binding protein [Marmoricola sp.]|nr:transporter substrate-binding protein [Marmoricola sp.]